MATTYKYVNSNPFAIYLPCERGGQAVFRTGESTTKQWYSQFCGRGQLTKVPVAEIPVQKVAPPPPPAPVVADKGVVIENIGALADALVQALGIRGAAQLVSQGAQPVAEAGFTSNRSMDQLAASMSKETTKKEGNVKEIGTTKVVKKNAAQTNETVSLLADLD